MAESRNKVEIREAGSAVEFSFNSPLLNDILKLEVIENQLFRYHNVLKSNETFLFSSTNLFHLFNLLTWKIVFFLPF